jgi:mercuric ion binding protein
MTSHRRSAKAYGIIFAAIMIAALLPTIAPAGEANSVYTLEVNGLGCPFCVFGIEKQLRRIDGVESISTDIKNGTVIVTVQAGVVLDEADAKQAIEDAGFTMRGFKRNDDSG